MQQHIGRVVVNSEIAPGYSLVTVHLPVVAAAARPGQFVHVKAGGGYYPLLRRPISIHRVDREQGLVYLLVEVRGPGTSWLAFQGGGTPLDIIGPLGTGFPRPSTERAVMVGGGVGMAPLVFLAEEMVHYGIEVDFLLGARSELQLLQREFLTGIGAAVQVATDDGSCGHHGRVTDLLPPMLAKGKEVTVYACGPRPMLKTVAELAAGVGVPCWLSLEEFMACGVGACRGCVTATRGNDEQVTYKDVCTDGPVFAAGEVVFFNGA